MDGLIDRVRFGIQLFMIFIAGSLFIAGVFYFNILFIIASLVLAMVFGRLFCGWLCPLGFYTERVLGKITDDRDFPKILKNSIFRYSFTAFFIAVFISLWYVFPYEPFLFPLILMGAMFGFATLLAVTSFDKAWCAYVCPWGTLSSLIGRSAPYQLAVKGGCEGCKACVEACPIDEVPDLAVETKKDGEPSEMPSRCIRCLKCSESCPNDSIDVVKRGS